MVWCPGPDDKYSHFTIVDHDGDLLSLGHVDDSDTDLPVLWERQLVRCIGCLRVSVVVSDRSLPPLLYVIVGLEHHERDAAWCRLSHSVRKQRPMYRHNNC